MFKDGDSPVMYNDVNLYLNIFGFLVILYFILMIIIAVAGIKISNRLREIVEQNEKRFNNNE
jgi:hypothetical protein